MADSTRPRRRARPPRKAADPGEAEAVEAGPEGTEAAEAPARAPSVPDWRRRLYRVPVLGTIVYIIWPPRKGKPSNLRRVLSWTAAIVAILGIGMAAYPVAGDKYPFFYRVPVEKLIEWSNFLSDMETNRIQDRLEKDFLALTDPRLAKDGDPLTRIQIPKIGVDTIVVQGTSLRALAAGAGHYPHTPLPGEQGNVGIAGHRTTHGRPFNKIDLLKEGDVVVLTTPVGRFTYTVAPPAGPVATSGNAAWITNPYDWSIVGASDKHILTLTACHPKGSARQRIVIRAEMTKSEPIQGAHKAA